MTEAPSPIDYQRALNWLRNTFGENNIRDDFPQEPDKDAIFCIYTDYWPIGQIRLHPDEIVGEFSKVQIEADHFASLRWKNRLGLILVNAAGLATNLEAAKKQFGTKDAEITQLTNNSTRPVPHVDLTDYTHGAPPKADIIDLAAKRIERLGRY